MHSNEVFFRNNIKFENLTIKQKQVRNYQRLIEGNVQYTNKSTTKYEEIVFTHNTQGSLGTLNGNTISKTLEVNTIIKKFHLVPKYPVRIKLVESRKEISASQLLSSRMKLELFRLSIYFLLLSSHT